VKGSIGRPFKIEKSIPTGGESQSDIEQQIISRGITTSFVSGSSPKISKSES